jgi:adenine-specific DNA-methyltransferase
MDEVFGEENFVGQFVWKTRQASGKQVSENNTSIEHEYVFCYGLNSLLNSVQNFFKYGLVFAFG